MDLKYEGLTDYEFYMFRKEEKLLSVTHQESKEQSRVKSFFMNQKD